MKSFNLACCLFLFALCLASLPAAAQHQNGCPADEFTMEGCVMCANNQPPHLTGHKNAQGELCFSCVGSGSAIAVPDVMPPRCVIMPVKLSQALGAPFTPVDGELQPPVLVALPAAEPKAAKR